MSSAPTLGMFAAIDIGTVTCRLLVARVTEDGACEEVVRGYRICNLGEGVDTTGRLRADAMERVRAAVHEFVSIRDAAAASEAGNPPFCPIPTVCVATSAARDAENAAEFRAVLAGEGVPLSVIPGEREAALSFAGASLDFAGEQVVVVDIGGGSTEIIAGTGGGGLAFAHSFNMGCRRLTERFFHTDPPTAGELAAAREQAREAFDGYIKEVRASGYEDARILAVAGTATSVVSVEKRLQVYDPTQVHGAFVPRGEVRRQVETLGAMTTEERRRVVGLDPKRAEVVVAGLVILDVILEAFGALGYTASETDLLHGAVLALSRGESW